LANALKQTRPVEYCASSQQVIVVRVLFVLMREQAMHQQSLANTSVGGQSSRGKVSLPIGVVFVQFRNLLFVSLAQKSSKSAASCKGCVCLFLFVCFLTLLSSKTVAQ
jgi:hypothetical protein